MTNYVYLIDNWEVIDYTPHKEIVKWKVKK